MKRLRERWDSWRLRKRVDKGAQTWGRQPSVTIEAKVIRADGTVEDLGVISKGRVEFIPEASPGADA